MVGFFRFLFQFLLVLFGALIHLFAVFNITLFLALLPLFQIPEQVGEIVVIAHENQGNAGFLYVAFNKIAVLGAAETA